MRSTSFLAAGAAIASAVALVVAGAPAASGAPGGPSITPVLTGLNSPRGIAFDGQGSMYLSESGAPGTSPDGGTTQTGRVSKYLRGHHHPAWSTTFTSAYAPSPGGGADVLGPEGISAMGSGCMKNSPGERRACQVLMIMSESTPGLAADGITDPQAGKLYRLDAATGRPRQRSDVGQQMWDWTGSHTDVFPSDFPDSNPYAVLVTKGAGGIRTFVADAGANTILEIGRTGKARIVAYIPNEAGPPFRDATPTCIAQGPDGYLYVGTLHLVSNVLFPPAQGGMSDVWRIDPNASYPAAPHLWASGLTTVTGCTFDRSGNFWASEMFAGGFAATPPGDVVRMPFAHPSTQTHLGAGVIAVPGGIAQGPDGAMYVTVGAAAGAGQGAVLRIAS